MTGIVIGIGIGIRRHSLIDAAIISALTELSCFATGIWINDGIWRMPDLWAYGPAEEKSHYE